MILPDVNVLVRAHRPDFISGPAVREWLEATLEGDERVAIWDALLLSTFRVLTHPSYVREADAATRAMTFLQEVRDASIVIQPGDRYWRISKRLIEQTEARSNLATDAGIAALCLETGCRLATFDRDFAKFPALQWFEPPIR